MMKGEVSGSKEYDDLYYKVAKRAGENWVPEYIFTLKKRDLSEFKDMCHYNQTSPLSHFTQNKFCSLPTEKGRITVTANKIKITEGDSDNRIAGEHRRGIPVGFGKVFSYPAK